MKRILVTGANGQLGNELRALSQQTTHSFLFTDIDSLDLTNVEDLERTLSDEKFDFVINCAAYTNVDKAEDDQENADKINHIAVKNLADVCAKYNTMLIHISTDYVFDGKNNQPYTEIFPTAPLGVYGKTKLDGELAVVVSGCRHIIIRTSWLYSSYGNNFVKTMSRLTSEKDSLKVVFDQVGTPTYARDLAQAILDIISQKKLDEKQGVYHFSNEGVCSWYDFAVEIRNQLGNQCEIQPCHSDEFPSKVTRPHYSVLDKTKIKDTFGVNIPYWKDSLKICINNKTNWK